MHRTCWAILLCLWWASPGSTAFANDLRIERQNIGPGVRVNFLKAELDKFGLRVLSPATLAFDKKGSAPDERSPKGLFLADYLVRFNALAVSSGGYVLSYSPPTALGIVKSEGMSTGTPHSSWATEAILCSDGKRVVIELTGSSLTRPDFPDCLQAGPMLLINGTPPEKHASTASYEKITGLEKDHAFACLDSHGRLLLGLTEKTKLSVVVGFLRTPAIGCAHAMRLDAGGLKLGDTLVGYDNYLIPSALGVVARQN